ncbi:MAG TPA: serine hydrolase [Ignavibacteriaceae bacterium]|nr:serine hydrolase [Ignavibacteriaceae bacterium]
MKKIATSFFVLLTLLLINTQNIYSQDKLEANLDSYVPKVLKEFKVPGIAVGVVKDGKLIFAKGYGVRSIESGKAVDANTLFQIASNSKAFTAACLAILVDEGKLSWDDRVIDKLPGFKMSDPYVTNEMRVRDLLCHRSGLSLGAGDLLYFPPTDYSRADILYRLRDVKLTNSFRSHYAYDNILYPVAGELIKAVTGKTWEEFVTEKIFNPLGMKSTRAGLALLNDRSDVETPHTIVDGKLTALRLTNWDATAPAGGILSSVNDLAKWVITQLDSGRIGDTGNKLFDKKETVQMWMPHINIPVRTPPPGMSALKSNYAAYGLGWFIKEYRGDKLIWHSGGLPGTVTQVTLDPDKKIGVIVLTNQESSAAFYAVTLHVLDELFNTNDTDWITNFSKLVSMGKNRADKKVAEMDSLRNKDSKPSLPLEKYAGKYKDAWYGTVTVKEENGKLYMSFDHTPNLTGQLEHWQYDTFVARWNDRTLHGDAFVTFSLNPDGSIAKIKMEKFRPDTDFSFDFQDLNLEPIK